MNLYEKIIDTGKVDYTDTSAMTNAEWLNLRTTGIGGSDAGAIMGMNKYATPLSCYLAKQNLVEEESKEKTNTNESIQWGKMAEAAIREGLAKDLNMQIESVPGMFTSVEFPFMNANVDGLVYTEETKTINGVEVTGLGGLEIKTATDRNTEFTDDEVPDSYYCQVQHYMSVTGLNWFILAVLIGKVSGKVYVIPRNNDFIARLREKESYFWFENVCKGVLPAPTGNERESEALNDLFHHANKEVVLGDEFAQVVEDYNSLNEQIKALKEQQEQLKEQLKIAIFSAANESEEMASDKVTATIGNAKVTWTKQVKKIVDTDLLKKSNLFDEYSKTSESLVMRITAAKKKVSNE